MQKFRISSGVVATLLALSACGGSNPPPPGDDAGPTPTVDSGTHVGNDSAVDTGGTTTGGTCASPISLDTAGTALASGTGRQITSSNATAPAAAMTTFANGSCAVDNGGAVTATQEVVFSYTVQTGGHLRLSTNNPTSDMNLDSIVWALDACSTGANELGCDDDDPNDPNQSLLSTAFTTTSVSAGTRVFIIVAGYMGATEAAGTFTLTVTEVPTNALGATCDMTASPFCADGSSCQLDDGADTAGHCLADGGANGACRIATPFCDSALVCTATAPTAADPGTCQTPIATGSACSQAHPVCVTGSTCLADEGSDTTGHCFADGSEYGACRVTGTACDGSFICSQATPTADDPGICQTPVAAGAACTVDHHFLCVTGYSCQSDDGVMPAGTCLADGSEYGACHLTGTACDSGLTCSETPPMDGDTCQMPIASGGTCTPRHNLCATGNSCVQTSDTMGTCNADGSEGAACRAADPQCDGTLACSFDGTCQMPG